MKNSVRYLWRIFFIGWGAIVLLILLINFGLFGKLPSLEELENPSASLASEVIASDGTVMGKYYFQDRSNVEYKDISPTVINALIATEDERFYEHSGIDGKSIARAIVRLGSDGGGSTITQQLAKNLLEQGNKNIVKRVIEKIKEWIVAVKLERNFTKEEILALYLNTVPYGNEIYGIRNAAKTYFQKEPDRLSVEEAAVLVGMLKGNTLYNPLRNPERAFNRRNTVLDQMVKANKLAAPEAERLKGKPIQLNYKKLDENTGFAPYFRDVLRDEMKKWCADHKKQNDKPYNLYTDGLKIYTTINPRMQMYAEEAVARHVSALQQSYNQRADVRNGSVWDGHESILERAMKDSDRYNKMKEDGASEAEIKKAFHTKVKMKVFAWNQKREKDTIMTPMDSIKYHRTMIQSSFMAMDPITGEVKAWVGGINFKTYKLDHANPRVRRQVGSTFKPILYTLAVENGFTPDQELPPGPINLGGKIITGGGGPMYVCLAKSLNPGAAYLMNQFGVNATIDFAKKCGITADLPPYPSIALGAGDISLYEMMRAYTMFPGGSFNTKPYYITRIEDRNGNVLAAFAPERKQVISEVSAYTMVKMMGGATQIGTARRLPGLLGRTVEMGCKTGTTNDNQDCWFMGYTPQLLAGSWVGCDDPFLKMQGDGARIAMPEWAYFFDKVYNDKTLGIDPEARFVKPAAADNPAILDWSNPDLNKIPDAEGEYVGNGSEDDFSNLAPVNNIGPESQQLTDEEKSVVNEAKKDNKEKDKPSVEKNPATVPADTVPKKKKGFFQRLFERRDKKKNE
ncbi:MAG: transglycosylase domain-containing protein [Sphingobacteriales bacterium]|nr:transglycosylase domain-containing protein [Sphingobacteriales bacterium]